MAVANQPRVGRWVEDPPWVSERWEARADAPFLPVRKAVDEAWAASPDWNLNSGLPERADRAWADYQRDPSLVNLYRASALLRAARIVDYRYDERRDLWRRHETLADAWMRLRDSVRSYEFSRMGYLMVSALDPLEIFASGLGDRLLRRHPSDEWVRARRSWELGSNADTLAAAEEQVRLAESLVRDFPRRSSYDRLLATAYNLRWMRDPASERSRARAQRAVTAMERYIRRLPADHPARATLKEILANFRRYRDELSPKP